MYLGKLANGSGDPRGPSAFQRRRERLQACRSKNALAYDWTIAKVGQPGLVGTAGIWGKYSPLHTQGVIPDPTLFSECDNGYPMYMQFQFQEAARKLIPTAEETAEAFAEEVRAIAPPLIQKPVVVPAPYGPAPPAPLPMPLPSATMPVEAPPPTEKKPGAGIGTALAIGIPIVLMMAGG